MRELQYDAVKGGAILLVVFGHVWIGLADAGLIGSARVAQTVEHAIYLFHMPAFFFVSGLFFAPKQGPRAFLRGKALTLLWPLLLWSWVEGALLAVSGQGADRGIVGLMDVLSYPVPVKSVFWFLWVLFVLQVASYAVMRLAGRWHPVVLLIAGLGAIAVFLLGVDAGAAVIIVENAPYFLAGVLLALLRNELVRPDPLPFVVGLAIFLLAEVVHLRDGAGAGWFQLSSLLATLGFVSTVGRAANTRIGRALAWLGKRTMAIYLIHIILTAGTRVMLLKLGLTDLGLHVVAGTAMGVAVPLAVDAVVQRQRLGRLAGFGQRA